MGLSEAELEARRSYLGGTDMSALAGLSPYAKPIDVWLDKRGESEPKSTAMMSMGSLLEPVVAALFAEASGYRVRRPGRAVRDRARPWLGGHIDRWVGNGEAILECKWIGGRKDDWGEAGTDRIPPGYAIQVQHYLGITGRQRGYLAALFGYAEFRWFEIRRDDALIEDLRELGRRFWHEHVLTGIPPEPDGSESYGSYLRRRWRAEPGLELVASAEQHVLWAQWRAAHELVLSATEREERAAQRIQASMGKATRLDFGDGHVTWSPYEEKRIDWHKVADAMAELCQTWLVADRMSEEEASEYVTEKLGQATAKHATTTTKRPFKPHPPKEESSDAQG